MTENQQKSNCTNFENYIIAFYDPALQWFAFQNPTRVRSNALW